MTFRPAIIALLPILWLIASGSAMAQTRDYRIDPDHSRVLFRVDHLGLSGTIGLFSNLHGEFRFDEDYWQTAHVAVTIPLDSIALGDDDWQEKVLNDYLHADRHPEARFEASELIRDDGETGQGTLRGQLTLNAISRPVELQLRHNGSSKGIYTKLRRKTGFSASTTIRRSDFGLDKQLDLVGDEVRIEIELEGIEQKR